MKRGKRSNDEEPEAAPDAVDEAAASRTWTEADDRAATAEPPTETWTPADARAAAAAPAPVVEGEAVELTGAAAVPEPSARPVPPTVGETPASPDPPAPAAIPVPPDPPPPAASPIVDVSAAPATAPSFDGHAAGPASDPLEPVRALVAERPEVAVGAAFAGGVLAAMILRRLGN